MTWVRLEDNINENAKLLSVSPEARWLWVCGLAFCNRQTKRTGIIPREVLRVISDCSSKRAIEELVKSGRWVEKDDGYEIHDYFKYQPTQEEVDAKSQSKSERARTAAKARWAKQSMHTHAETHAEHDASAMHKQCLDDANEMLKNAPDPDPDPIIRNIYIPAKAEKRPRARKELTEVPASDATAEAFAEWVAKWGFTQDESHPQFMRFVNHFRASGVRKKDWRATWENWKTSPFNNAGKPQKHIQHDVAQWDWDADQGRPA